MNARALTLLATFGWAAASCTSTGTTSSASTSSGGSGATAGGAGTGGATSTSGATSGAGTSGASTSGAGTSGAATSGSGTSGSGTSGTGGSEDAAPIHFLGRFDTSNPAEPAFSWPGSAITTRFSGTGLDVSLHDDGQNFFAVSIDGAAPTVLATTSAKDTYTLAKGLADGVHDAVLFRRTESFQGIVHFKGFTPAGGKPLIPTPAPYKRHLEVVGDSITCGYGNEGAGPSCPFSPDTENAWLAYGTLTARALAAEPHLIAYSGKGAYREYGGSLENQMPVLYERTFAEVATSTWDFSRWQADVVVVNLGTNDFAKGDPGQLFVDAYTGLVKKIRGHYPGAYILCAVGSMLTGADLVKATGYVKGVVSALSTAGDKKISFVDLGQQDAANGLGCDYHPSLTTHKLMADKLTAAIKAVTGW